MDKCVLIVDDNDFNRELVKDILEDEDITVYEAEDGSSAIELLESEQADDIDVVLMDMRMPGMDGIETTKIIRTKNGKCMEVPIIAMTADGFETDIGMLQKAGMNGLISKPVDGEYIGRTYNKTGRVVNTLPVLRVYYLDSPIKKSATVPGPECVPIVGHI